jgi:hypothetical protein
LPAGWTIVNSSDASTINNQSSLGAYFTSNTAIIDASKNGSASVPNLTIQTSGGTAAQLVLATNAIAALTINGSTQAATFSSSVSISSTAGILTGTAIPAGGTTGSGYLFSSTANYGVFFGSGAPTLSAAKGSLYLRSDGSATNNRAYINTDSGTTWTALTTAA